MKSSIFLAAASATTALATALAPRASSLPVISVQGNMFMANNQRFYIRGVDYQPGGSSNPTDPLASSSGCARDIPEFQKLGINTVRVYTVDNTANHDTCMTQLANAGIYVVLDVNTPKYSLNRDDPAPSYNDEYLQSVFATIDRFQNYTNVLAFLSGNEVINDGPSSICAPYVKAVTRDMKQYINNRGYRLIPVGYAAADVEQNRLQLAEYLNCGTDDQRSDFYAFNDYEWCDPSSFQQSGWSTQVSDFANYSIPLFFSEYGCIKGTRGWTDVASLYNSEMTGVFSGGLVYQYSEESDNPGFGLVNIQGNSVSEINGQFSGLATAFKNDQAPSGNGGGRSSSGSPSVCPPQSSFFNVTGDALPAIPAGAVKYMSAGAGSGPGLSGSGSQEDASGESTGTASAGSGQPTKTSSPSTGGTPISASSGSASSSAAAANIRVPEIAFTTPLVCGFALMASTFLGAFLL